MSKNEEEVTEKDLEKKEAVTEMPKSTGEKPQKDEEQKLDEAKASSELEGEEEATKQEDKVAEPADSEGKQENSTEESSEACVEKPQDDAPADDQEKDETTDAFEEPVFSAHVGKRPEYEEKTQKEKDAEAYKAEQEKKAMKEVLLGTDKVGYAGDHAADGKSLSFVKFVCGLHIMFAVLCLVLRFHPNPLFKQIFDSPNVPVGLGLMFLTLAFLISLNDALVIVGAMVANIMGSMYLAAQGFDLLRDKEKAILAVFPCMLTCLAGLSALIICYRFFKNRNFHL